MLSHRVCCCSTDVYTTGAPTQTMLTLSKCLHEHIRTLVACDKQHLPRPTYSKEDNEVYSPECSSLAHVQAT